MLEGLPNGVVIACGIVIGVVIYAIVDLLRGRRR